MKRNLYIVLLFATSIAACKRSAPKTEIQKPEIQKIDTIVKREEIPVPKINWIDDFRNFRSAVVQNKKDSLAAYFNLPIVNESNDIWYFLFADNEKGLKLIGNKPKPFTSSDLEKYSHQLFPAHFVNSILKIKTDSLFKTGEYATPALSDGKTITYQMFASYNEKEKQLTLNLSYVAVYVDKKGQPQDNSESNLIYTFSIDESGHLKFNNIQVAG